MHNSEFKDNFFSMLFSKKIGVYMMNFLQDFIVFNDYIKLCHFVNILFISSRIQLDFDVGMD